MPMGGIITTGNHPAALWPGIKLWHGTSYAEFPQEWTDLVDQDTSSRAYEMLAQDVNFPMAQEKPQGQGLTYASDQQGYMTKITHVTYAQGYIVTMEEMEDNLYPEVAKKRAYKNAFAMRQCKEFAVCSFYNLGFGTARLGADGVGLFNSAHQMQNGQTYSNVPTIAADLSETALEDAIIDIEGWTDDAGNIINITANKLIVGRSNRFNVTRILQSTLQNDTANNAVNALRLTGALSGGVAVNHYLTTPTNWFLRTSVGKQMGGLTLFQRKAMVFDTDNDFGTKNALAAAIERYSVGYGDARTGYGVNA